MPLLRFTVTPRGAFGTPMRSDTLHGHLLCAAGELDGADAVGEIISRFDSGPPPFVCSSALPQGMLPMPCLPPIKRREFHDRYGKNSGLFGGDLFEALSAYKAFRKVPFVPQIIWTDLRSNMSPAALFERWIAETRADKGAFQPKSALYGDVWRVDHVVSHNSIDRNTGSVLQEGGLYLSDATLYGSGVKLDLYVRTEEPEQFERLIGHIAETGFGRDRSTGKGWFDIERDMSFDAAHLKGTGTHRMSLSVLSAQDMSEVRGWYRTFPKTGRTWDGFGERNPFKKTFLAFEEGAVLEKLPSKGYVLHGIHADPKVVQVTWPLTIALTLQTTEAA